jgi:hypothetical protein
MAGICYCDGYSSVFELMSSLFCTVGEKQIPFDKAQGRLSTSLRFGRDDAGLEKSE